jgi:hypothetical protein
MTCREMLSQLDAVHVIHRRIKKSMVNERSHLSLVNKTMTNDLFRGNWHEDCCNFYEAYYVYNN